ncbi:MAG: hypothetical protein UT34_C0001G0256 [candidate division WS6 bacterium GW2011_GWF2_39_15]|uniref:Uncharacterized protein n=1 Tax=candidate division WS6 bacterium GW2011_GWF2_39_15 TaxID=1619100 RepID=A0A0G0N073_9BACT|nr:MAG: hypothetical protein UT34_C0001G0256 [candidate division WS6 bacterium GW2011_GWF2_39_15]
MSLYTGGFSGADFGPDTNSYAMFGLNAPDHILNDLREIQGKKSQGENKDGFNESDTDAVLKATLDLSKSYLLAFDAVHDPEMDSMREEIALSPLMLVHSVANAGPERDYYQGVFDNNIATQGQSYVDEILKLINSGRDASDALNELKDKINYGEILKSFEDLRCPNLAGRTIDLLTGIRISFDEEGKVFEAGLVLDRGVNSEDIFNKKFRKDRLEALVKSGAGAQPQGKVLVPVSGERTMGGRNNEGNRRHASATGRLLGGLMVIATTLVVAYAAVKATIKPPQPPVGGGDGNNFTPTAVTTATPDTMFTPTSDMIIPPVLPTVVSEPTAVVDPERAALEIEGRDFGRKLEEIRRRAKVLDDTPGGIIYDVSGGINSELRDMSMRYLFLIENGIPVSFDGLEAPMVMSNVSTNVYFNEEPIKLTRSDIQVIEQSGGIVMFGPYNTLDFDVITWRSGDIVPIPGAMLSLSRAHGINDYLKAVQNPNMIIGNIVIGEDPKLFDRLFEGVPNYPRQVDAGGKFIQNSPIIYSEGFEKPQYIFIPECGQLIFIPEGFTSRDVYEMVMKEQPEMAPATFRTPLTIFESSDLSD